MRDAAYWTSCCCSSGQPPTAGADAAQSTDKGLGVTVQRQGPDRVEELRRGEMDGR